jgi:hypothetical protein
VSHGIEEKGLRRLGPRAPDPIPGAAPGRSRGYGVRGLWALAAGGPLLRRTLLALSLTTPAAAQSEFPAQIELAGRRLLLNGTGARLYSVFAIEVYRAALYLEAPLRDAERILASPGPKLILARYRRDVPLRGVIAAWEASFQAICGCPLPAAFRDWLAPLPAGAEERFLIRPGAVRLEATGRPALELQGADIARTLLLAWIGPQAPTEALRQGLLGLSQ